MANLCSQLLIVLNRYLDLQHNIQNSESTQHVLAKHTIPIIMLIWVFSFLLAIRGLIFHGLQSIGGMQSCGFDSWVSAGLASALTIITPSLYLEIADVSVSVIHITERRFASEQTERTDDVLEAVEFRRILQFVFVNL